MRKTDFTYIKMKNILLGSLTLAAIALLPGLEAAGQNDPKKLPSVMTPEAANLGKYGAYNINYHTGSPNISVPVYDFKENGISVNLALKYDAGGFIPNKSAGITGLNWNLSSGGAITRIVNGEPDEKNNPDPSTVDDQQDHTNIGYIYGIKNGLGTYSSEHIRTLQFLNLAALGSPGSSLNYEYAPDIFSFNFLGHSGTFFMDNSGQMKVQSERRYRIDMAEFTGAQGIYDISTLLGNMTNTQINQNIISRIKITSDDGYVFYFGGTLSTLELGFSYPSATSVSVDGRSARINAWYLTRIQTPDGNNVYYNYQSYSNFDCNTIRTVVNISASDGLWNNYVEGNEFFEVKLAWNDHVNLDPNSGQGNNINQRVKSLTKLAYLKEIISQNKKISFLYSEKDRNNHFYTSNDHDFYINANPEFFTQKLDKIIVQDLLNISPVTEVSDGATTYAASRYIEFTYDYLGSTTTGYRLSLNHISTHAPGAEPLTYSFDYYDLGLYPDPMTKGLDLWGFYNGTSNTTLAGLPQVNDPEFEVDFNAITVRTPTPGNTTLAGFYPAHRILTKITYPTKGTTEFVFENNVYRKVLKRKVSSGINPVLETLQENEVAGGLRIKKIVNSPGTTTDFFYNTDYQTGNTTSSGLLTSYEVNFLSAYAPTLNLGNGNYFGSWSDNNMAPASSYAESHIEYGQVQEVQTGNGYTNYTYSTVETNPDIYSLGSGSYTLRNPDASYNNFNNQLLRLFKYSSRASERGKLLKQEIFNEQNVRLNYIQNTYNSDPGRLNERGIAYYKYAFIPNLWLCHSYANYYYHDNLTQQINSQFDPTTNSTINTVTTYTYKSNSNPLLVEKKIMSSDNTGRITKYKYPEDYPADPVYQGMTNLFMVGTIVETSDWEGEQQLQTVNNNFYQTEGANLYKVQSVTAKNDLVPVSASNPYELVHFYRYDASGNLLEAAKSSGPKIAYKWDYNRTCLVAEISGSVEADVSYTSFESSVQDGWTYDNTAITRSVLAPMGARLFRLNQGASSYTITKTLSLSSNAILSFWFKGSSISVAIPGLINPAKEFTRNGWNYREYKIAESASSITISGSGLLDELRLYPEKSQMRTYTYNPFYGITFQCDQNNNILSYEYDGFGRLLLIRDDEQNIIKKFCYNYSDQPVSCAFDATPNWQSTGETRCQSCAANSAYNSGNTEHEEKDYNPNSTSYNTLRWISDGPGSSCASLPDWQNTATALRCKTVNGINTGEREQEQRDMNPCSPGGGQTRWIVIDQNCSVCPKPQNWQSTGNYRCVASGGNNTGEQEREEINTESCSVNYNQTRWVSVGTNCTACAKPPNWQLTGNYRCVTSGGNNTGEREREEINTESCSANYNQTRWVSVGNNCTTCPKPSNWQPTGNLRCAKDAGNNNTGYQEREEKDMESCSATYNQTRWVAYAYNATACPVPCLPTNCPGKCINGVCDTGTMKIISAVREKIDGIWYWRCTWVRCFSDGTYDMEGEELSLTSCLSQVSSCP